MKNETLIKFLRWYRKYEYRYQNEEPLLVINHYIDFISGASSESQSVRDNE